MHTWSCTSPTPTASTLRDTSSTTAASSSSPFHTDNDYSVTQNADGVQFDAYYDPANITAFYEPVRTQVQ
jgi:hypothetical protein